MEQQGLVLVMCGHRITKHSWVIAKVNLGHVHAYGTTKVNLGCVWAWNNKANNVIKKG
jgi:hypothetical protein